MDGTLAESTDYTKTLYYGPAKNGKTTYMAGAARLGKIVAIDTEGNGWLKAPLRKRGIPLENIIYRTATTYAEMENLYWDILRWITQDETDIVAVCIDHLSDLEKRFLRENTIRRQSNKVQHLKERSAIALMEQGVNPFLNEIGDYGVWTNQARHLMRLYRDLPCHVAFAAHTRLDLGKKVPGLTEMFREELMGAMNFNIGCDVLDLDGGPTFVGYAAKASGWMGGDRLDVLKPMVANPSLDRLIKLASGEIDIANDPEQLALRAKLQ